LAEAIATPRGRCAIGVIQAADQFAGALLELQNGHQAIGQENISGTKQVPQTAEQPDFALSLIQTSPKDVSAYDRLFWFGAFAGNKMG